MLADYEAILAESMTVMASQGERDRLHLKMADDLVKQCLGQASMVIFMVSPEGNVILKHTGVAAIQLLASASMIFAVVEGAPLARSEPTYQRLVEVAQELRRILGLGMQNAHHEPMATPSALN